MAYAELSRGRAAFARAAAEWASRQEVTIPSRSELADLGGFTGPLHYFHEPPMPFKPATPFIDQADFMKASGQTTDSFNPRQVALYTGLQLEELGEKMRAFGLLPAAEQLETLGYRFKEGFYDQYVVDADKLELFDADLDIAVVTAGSLLSAGSPADAGWIEVHRSNMAKVDPATRQVLKDSSGKVQKPVGWTRPDLAALLKST